MPKVQTKEQLLEKATAFQTDLKALKTLYESAHNRYNKLLKQARLLGVENDIKLRETDKSVLNFLTALTAKDANLTEEEYAFNVVKASEHALDKWGVVPTFGDDGHLTAPNTKLVENEHYKPDNLVYELWCELHYEGKRVYATVVTLRQSRDPLTNEFGFPFVQEQRTQDSAKLLDIMQMSISAFNALIGTYIIAKADVKACLVLESLVKKDEFLETWYGPHKLDA